MRAATLLVLVLSVAAAAAASADAPTGAATAGGPHRRLLQPAAKPTIIVNPAPYTYGAFNGKIVPVPQGPLLDGGVRAVNCQWVTAQTALTGKQQPGDPGNWLESTLDVLIDQPACRLQNALATYGRRLRLHR